jgi:hypothetical protein
MKWIVILFLDFASTIFSCVNNREKGVTNAHSQDSSSISETHPNDLFKNNCSMCHGYNKDMTAPAIVSYTVDSILKFYDGKSRKDSLWLNHKKIQLTRNDWEKIAIHMQPGDFFPKK